MNGDNRTGADWGIPFARSALPRVCANGRQLRDISADALHALQRANEPPLLFARGGLMVAVVRDEKGRQVIAEVTESVLRGRLARSANYYKLSAKSNEYECAPPLEVVRDIQSLEPAIWNFHCLDGVVEAPILRADGSILHAPGYDQVTQLYYAPDPDLRIPPIADPLETDDIERAKDLIEKAIADFPFVDQPSKANAIAAMMTPVVKPAIMAPAPIAIIDAPQAGTGKSLLCEVIAIITTGRPGEMFSAPVDPDEWRKQITTALMSGTAVVIIDNVNRRLESGDLCKVLTESIHADRMFRTHTKLALPVKSTWLATGNNVQVGGDLPRRCFWVRLDAKMSRPFLRSGFQIEDLKAWASAQRGELLAALLTLARSWYVADKPKSSVKLLGSFESWSRTVGGILEHAGIDGFLGNASELYEQADAEAVQWEGFLHVLKQEFYDEPFTISQLAEALQSKTWNESSHSCEPTQKATRVRDALPDFLAEAMDRDGFFRRRAGKCFAERAGRRFGASQIHLERSERVHHAQQWRVESSGEL